MPQKTTIPKNIAFFMEGRWNPTDGCIRPFLNWTKQITANGGEVDFILHKCGRKQVDFFSRFPSGPGKIRVLETRSDDDIKRSLDSITPSAIITDDYVLNLRAIKGLGSKPRDMHICIYAQVLFGSHSITEVFKTDKLRFGERLLLETSKAIPFSFLKQDYMNTLRQRCDIVIANSQTTASYLQVFYGIEPHGIVYPPVDMDVFKRASEVKRRQALVYLGSNAGDTDPALIRRILKELERSGIEALVFGNQWLRKELEKDGAVMRAIGAPGDDALAKAYSESLITICPQKWEQFGYVAAESIACGTPPLAFNCMGIAETVRMSSMGILANRTDEFLDAIRNIDETAPEHAASQRFPFDSRESTSSLLAILRNQKTGHGR